MGYGSNHAVRGAFYLVGIMDYLTPDVMDFTESVFYNSDFDMFYELLFSKNYYLTVN